MVQQVQIAEQFTPFHIICVVAVQVVSLMERVIKAAMDAKQSSLRPEIQLLNKLIAMTEASERQKVGQWGFQGRSATPCCVT